MVHVKFLKLVFFWAIINFIIFPTYAEEQYRPYALAGYEDSSLESSFISIKEKLINGGFEIAGEYGIGSGDIVLVITNQELNSIASQTEFGGYGAAQRVALTKRNNRIQISYTSPVYMGNMYQMNDLSGIYEKLKNTLGFRNEFGAEDGMTVEDMREYHYMVTMPYFEDQYELAKHKSYEEAIATVEKGLQDGKFGASMIYRIDIQGKDETVYGVSITQGDGADETVLKNCDKTEPFHTAYLPYEFLVSGKMVYALDGKFRIALSFPDLSMSTFMKISGAPGDIEDVLEAVALNKKD